MGELVQLPHDEGKQPVEGRYVTVTPGGEKPGHIIGVGVVCQLDNLRRFKRAACDESDSSIFPLPKLEERGNQKKVEDSAGYSFTTGR